MVYAAGAPAGCAHASSVLSSTIYLTLRFCCERPCLVVALRPTSRRPCEARRRGAGSLAGLRRSARRAASPRRRAGIDATPSTRNEARRRAGTWGAPFGYLALFWTLAAFSFCWRAAQSEAERPSGTYLGVFKYRERARVRGQLNGDERQPSRVETLIYSGSILCSCARRGRRPRATASHRCFFRRSALSRRAARGPAAPRRKSGGAPGR